MKGKSDIIDEVQIGRRSSVKSANASAQTRGPMNGACSVRQPGHDWVESEWLGRKNNDKISFECREQRKKGEKGIKQKRLI